MQIVRIRPGSMSYTIHIFSLKDLDRQVGAGDLSDVC